VSLAGGLGTWCFARENTNHVGASGMVFGYFGFCVAAIFWERPVVMKSVFVLLLVMVFYGHMLVNFGFTSGDNTSWEGHLAGFAAGVFFSFLYFRYFQRKWDQFDYLFDEYTPLP